ncbi:MAG: hypothetical protein QF921_09985 [Pseudomonadales bacterium]|jgi:hypothetical protein|nr:hypothetical protein [Pseudomonadales bacterium]MDP6472330.1 hypothetical protein [Pseudomonadales bacterium]MDP6828126.1 hypothetical protein [Pseudomonadales bacterium]MDP6971824.1 hypothetical protein [Pseudomonadales bacterium]|tara:strand:+ start:2791 stop:2946 length:156 start_codon:yes stop_codon:yes gene_type:complete
MRSIDLFDVRQGKGAWHGWAVQPISDADRIEPGSKVDAIVRIILLRFPPSS